jgi:hypothetical protein
MRRFKASTFKWHYRKVFSKPPYEHICGCFNIQNFTSSCWIMIKLVVGAWTMALHCHNRPWTSSIKPSLQHFQFRRVGVWYFLYVTSGEIPANIKAWVNKVSYYVTVLRCIYLKMCRCELKMPVSLIENTP